MTLAQSLLMSLLAVFPYRMISGNRRIYRWDRYNSMRWELVDILMGLGAGSTVIWVFAQVFHPGNNTASWLLRWIGTALLGIAASRCASHFIVHRLHRRGVLTHRVAILGAGDEGVAAVEHLTGDRPQNGFYEIVGIFDERADRCQKQIKGIPVTKGIDSLIEISRATHIDAIVVALPMRAHERISLMMQKLNSIPAEILLLMDISWLNVKEVQLRNMDGYSFLQVARRPLVGGHAILKAVEDYVVAAIALLLCWPVMLAAAIAIRMEGPGPVLFRQRRVGFNHREFDLLKFRSMGIDPHDDGARGTIENDPRVTRVGRFLRQHSIDELPQLFNVLRGEMAVVGPRAHVPKMLVGKQIYPEAVIEYPARHRVKPGITGWAQINGMRGGIHTEAKARRGVELDLEYVEGWSPWLDIQIMARTLFGGLWGRSVF
ncbi:MAG: sugar transferase [Acidobacteriota bacterium]|nr:sugar transferase [Acidobacteriota bacterium]